MTLGINWRTSLRDCWTDKGEARLVNWSSAHVVHKSYIFQLRVIIVEQHANIRLHHALRHRKPTNITAPTLHLIPPVLSLEQRPHALALWTRHDQIHNVARRIRPLLQLRAVQRRHVVWRLREAEPPERDDELVSDTVEVAWRRGLEART